MTGPTLGAGGEIGSGWRTREETDGKDAKMQKCKIMQKHRWQHLGKGKKQKIQELEYSSRKNYPPNTGPRTKPIDIKSPHSNEKKNQINYTRA